MTKKFLIIFGLGFLALMIPSNAFAEFNVELPPPLAVTDIGFEPISLPNQQGTFVEASGINCKVKQTTQWFDQSGALIDTVDSTGIQGSPFAQLAFTFGLMDEDIKHFQVIPKIFCSELGGLPVEAWIKQMSISTVAEFEGSGRVVDTLSISQSPLLQFGTGQGEQELANRVITSLDLEEHLPERNLGVNWRFQITGTVNVAYSNFPQIVYQIPILWNELDTLVATNVLKAPPFVEEPDADGDGLIDRVDDCPNEPENFNGFQDADGCPDIKPLDCPTGMIPNPENLFCIPEPVDEMMPLNCEAGDLTTNDQIFCMNQCLSGGNEWRIDPDTGKGFCTEKNPEIIIDGMEIVTVEEFLSGQIRMVGSTIYKDLSQDTFVIQEGIFFSSIGQIQPLTVTTIISGQERDIERIEVEVYYIFPNTADAVATTLEDSDLNFRPAIRITATEQRLGSPFLGQVGDVGQIGSQQIPFGTGTGIGNGFLLSKGVFLARDIQALGTQLNPVTGDPLIGEGNSADVTFQVDVTGDFTFSREGQTGIFTIDNAFVAFSDIFINNKVGVQDTPCLGGQVPFFDVDMQQLGCTNPPEGDRDADGVSDNADACPDEFGTVSFNGCPAPDAPDRPDTDGDGIPDFQDPDIDGDGIPNETDPDIDGDGIPNEDEVDPCEGGRLTMFGSEVICVKDPIEIGGNNGQVCSLTQPQNCPTLPMDFNTILIVGGVLLVIIAIIVVIARRR